MSRRFLGTLFDTPVNYKSRLKSAHNNPTKEDEMPYKIKNGIVFVLYQGKYWLDTVLYSVYPELKTKGLHNG